MNEIKPGYKTTEFWITMVQSIAGIAVTVGVFTPDIADTLVKGITSVVGGVVAIISVVSYIRGRTEVKLGQIAAGKQG